MEKRGLGFFLFIAAGIAFIALCNVGAGTVNSAPEDSPKARRTTRER